MFELRDYQQEAVDAVFSAVFKQETVLLQAATGAGKTIIFSALIDKFKAKWQKIRVLVLAHQENLVRQNYQKLCLLNPELKDKISIACSSVQKKADYSGEIIFASPQTTVRHLNEIGKISLIIVDECHHIGLTKDAKKQYYKILDFLKSVNPSCRLVGVTATPYTMRGTIYGTDKDFFFKKLDYEISIHTLVEKGYLSHYQIKSVEISDIKEGLKGVSISTTGDYSISETSSLMCRKVFIEDVVEAYKEACSDREHTLVFCVTIEHAELVCDAFNQNGIPAAVSHSKLNKELDKQATHDFVDGKVKVLCNVAKLTEGWDCPNVDCLIMARPTMSTTLYVQMCGRGLRTAEGKKDCLILDLVGNFDKFQDPNEPIVYQEEKPEKRYCPACGQKIPSNCTSCPYCGFKVNYERVCPLCAAIIRRTLAQCPECGHIFPKQSLEEQNGEIKDITTVYSSSDKNSLLEHVFHINAVIFKRDVSKAGNDMLRIIFYGYSDTAHVNSFSQCFVPPNISKLSAKSFKKFCMKYLKKPLPSGSIDDIVNSEKCFEFPPTEIIRKEGNYWKIAE